MTSSQQEPVWHAALRHSMLSKSIVLDTMRIRGERQNDKAGSTTSLILKGTSSHTYVSQTEVGPDPSRPCRVDCDVYGLSALGRSVRERATDGCSCNGANNEMRRELKVVGCAKAIGSSWHQVRILRSLQPALYKPCGRTVVISPGQPLTP